MLLTSANGKRERTAGCLVVYKYERTLAILARKNDRTRNLNRSSSVWMTMSLKLALGSMFPVCSSTSSIYRLPAPHVSRRRYPADKTHAFRVLASPLTVLQFPSSPVSSEACTTKDPDSAYPPAVLSSPQSCPSSQQATAIPPARRAQRPTHVSVAGGRGSPAVPPRLRRRRECRRYPLVAWK